MVQERVRLCAPDGRREQGESSRALCEGQHQRVSSQCAVGWEIFLMLAS